MEANRPQPILFHHDLIPFSGIPLVIDIHAKEHELGMEYDVVDYAEAYANTLRFSLMDYGTSFGAKLNSAMNGQEVGHHGHPHSRIVEKSGEWMLRLILEKGKFDPEKPGFFEDLVAFSMFHYLHDLDQQMTALYNVENETNINEKKGHGVGAALMALAMAKDLADSTGIEMERARKIMNSAAIMMMRHDDPEKFDKTFNPENKKAYEFENNNDLLNAFLEDKLDVFSLSPSQLMHILDKIKTKKGNKIPGSTYGLDPDFGKEHSESLAKMSSDQESLFDQSDPTFNDQRERVINLTRTAYDADMINMICPYNDQIPRTLQTQYSIEREFSTFSDPQSTVKNSFDRINQENGNGLKGDDERIFWELLHFGNISKNLIMADIPEISQFTREHVMLSAIAFKNFGIAIMGGDFDYIANLYTQRILDYEEKRDRRFEKYPENLSEIECLFHLGLGGIEKERYELIKFFKTEKNKKYSQDAIFKFQFLAANVIEKLIDRFQVTPEEYEMWNDTATSFKRAETQFFTSNDSLPFGGFKRIDPETRKIIIS